MLKMIIIEDEKLEREGLVEFFDWNSMDVEIVGTASDGIEGMELAEKIKPDIIITDIKMPGMNGLDMSKKIKEILPKTKIIILTGYGDFKFAKQAIGISVSAYILKPIEEEELINTIKTIVSECKRNQSRDLILDKEYYSEKTRFFIDLLEGKLEREKSNIKVTEFGINAQVDAEFTIVAIKPIKDGNEVFQELSFQVKNMVNKNICFFVPDEKENVIFICLSVHTKQEVSLDDIFENLSTTNFIGIGIRVQGIYDIKESAVSAKKALDYGLFWFDSGIFYYKDILYNNEQTGNFIILGNKFSKQLILAVGSSQETVVKDTLGEIFEFINENKNVDKKYICNYLYKVIYETSLIVYNVDRNNEKDLSGRNDFGSPLLELKSLKQINIYTYSFFEKVIDLLNKKRNNKDEHTIKAVVKIVEEKYMESINLKSLASEVYLSPNFLGNIFKKYMGKSFNDYLSQYRMEKARDLLKDSNKKISSVAKDVGIPNTSYFCMIFKSTYGMAPKEYQEMLLRN